MSTQNTILVTGGASGIGLAIVEAIVAEGWHVIVTDADPGNLERARERLSSHPGQVTFEFLDVTNETAVAETVARCDVEIGPLTGLVNSAGIGKDVPFLDTTTTLFRKTLEVNLLGSFITAREAARVMLPRRQGSIVNIASVSGIRGNSGRAAYGASKAGVIIMTQVMAVELAQQGIRVNAIAPGPIETPLVSQMHTDAARTNWKDRVPQRRYGTPEEVAGAAIFLLDHRRSSFITGQTICVDGGFTSAGLIGT